MFSKESDFCKWQLRGLNNASVQLFKTLPSTHRLMKEKAIKGDVPLGTLFVADHQSKSRGRHERTWDSPAGKNLYFNVLIPLDEIPANRYAQITQIIAITFAEIFQSFESSNEKKISVKWPNDILYEKKKFCGILPEVIFIPDANPALNVGIGINVNSSPSEYAHLNREVTTLKTIAGKAINREKLLQVLIIKLEESLKNFKQFGIIPWIDSWKKMSNFIGTQGTIIINNHCTDINKNNDVSIQKKSGIILDINSDGSLLFKCDDGSTKIVYSADLEI